MIVWRRYIVTKYKFGVVDRQKEYKWLLLFGFLPLFVSING